MIRVFQLKAFPVHCLLSLNINNMISDTVCIGHGPEWFNSNNILGRITELERRPKSTLQSYLSAALVYMRGGLRCGVTVL